MLHTEKHISAHVTVAGATGIGWTRVGAVLSTCTANASGASGFALPDGETKVVTAICPPGALKLKNSYSL